MPEFKKFRCSAVFKFTVLCVRGAWNRTCMVVLTITLHTVKSGANAHFAANAHPSSIVLFSQCRAQVRHPEDKNGVQKVRFRTSRHEKPTNCLWQRLKQKNYRYSSTSNSRGQNALTSPRRDQLHSILSQSFLEAIVFFAMPRRHKFDVEFKCSAVEWHRLHGENAISRCKKAKSLPDCIAERALQSFSFSGCRGNSTNLSLDIYYRLCAAPTGGNCELHSQRQGKGYSW